MDEIHKIGLISISISWLLTIVIAISFYFGLNKPYNSIWTKSFILGMATSLMNFGLTFSGGKGFLDEIARPNNSGKPVKKTVLNYGLRLLVAGFIFAAIIFNQYSNNPKLNIIPALIGYATFKVVLIIVTIIKKGKVSKQ